jgi:hypothetical protein
VYSFSYPTKEDKAQLGSAIVSVMPGLKDTSADTGYVCIFFPTKVNKNGLK